MNLHSYLSSSPVQQIYAPQNLLELYQQIKGALINTTHKAWQYIEKTLTDCVFNDIYCPILLTLLWVSVSQRLFKGNSMRVPDE
jgi:hypothetical protein